MPVVERLAQPLLRRLDPERAHALAIAGLSLPWPAWRPAPPDPRLAVDWLGGVLPGPLCLAAGFDKNAAALRGLARLGFDAVEVGTVTRLAQAGNPRPRLFRLPEERAIINRMGFNSGGLVPFLRGLRAKPHGLTVGANVGPNRGVDPREDLPRLVDAVVGLVHWVTINISSPNTAGLRDWQAPARIADLLQAIAVAVPMHPPLLVKIAPDLEAGLLPEVVAACLEGGAAGLVIANTTTARPADLRGRHAGEAGGLSGPPLMDRSTALLAHAARLAAGKLALVGVGGIARGVDVVAKLRAGAGLVQFYTAFAFEGPALLPRLRGQILQELQRQGFADVRAAIGADL